MAETNKKGVLGTLYEDIVESGPAKWVEDKYEKLKHTAAVNTGYKADPEALKKARESGQYNVDTRHRRGIYKLKQDMIKKGLGDDFDISRLSKEDILKAGDSVPEAEWDAHSKDKDFMKQIADYEAKGVEQAGEAARLAKKGAFNEQLGSAMRAIATDKKEYLPPPGGTRGSVNVDLAGMQGVLNARGNMFASAPAPLKSQY